MPDNALIDDCLVNKPWDFGNQVLYDLCKQNPLHSQQDQIIAKVWLIGRSYSVALERFKRAPKDPKEETNLPLGDEFYVRTIPDKFITLDIDDRLSKLKKHGRITKENLKDSLETHGYLTNELSTITNNQNKRSFSSKYLHFHVPEMFFIYDSRVVEAMRGCKYLIPPNINALINDKKVDREYAIFCYKCLDFRDEIEATYSKQLTNRQIDNLLIKLKR